MLHTAMSYDQYSVTKLRIWDYLWGGGSLCSADRKFIIASCTMLVGGNRSRLGLIEVEGHVVFTHAHKWNLDDI